MSVDFSIFKSPNYHQHQLMVHSYDVDFNKHLTLTSLFNYFQEIAWEHAGVLRFGYEDLSENNQFWVLSRMRVEISRLPQWTENIKLITYPRGLDGIFALRDYEIYDSNDERIVSASSSWIVLNAQTHRPSKLMGENLERYSNERKALTVNASKIRDVNMAPIKEEYLVVKVGDIDVNNHVNNTRYIDWAYNAFSVEHYKSNTPKIIEVNFLAEGKQNDRIKLDLFSIADNENVVCIKREDDQKDLCRILINWDGVE